MEDKDYHGSSSSSDSESDIQPWIEDVQSDGSLFYIEYEADSNPFLEDSLNHSYPDELRSHRGQLKSKFKAAEKIKKWMKERKKKGHKSFPLKSQKTDKNLNSFSSLDTYSHFQSKDVFLVIDSTEMDPNCKLSLSEKLFGLKLGSVEDTIIYGISDKPVVVNFVPSSEVTGFKIGDVLKSVNDIEINIRNIDDVLKGILPPAKVKLTFLTPLNLVNPQLDLSSNHGNLLKELLWDSSAIQQAKLQCQHVSHGLLFLSTEDENELYVYPDENIALFQLKGMFQTLGHMIISELASSPLLSCSVMVQGKIVHAGFVKEETNIMILALPASVASSSEVQHFSSTLSKLFRYQFSSLQKTFMTANVEFLDNFLTLYFKHHLSSLHYTEKISFERHLLDILPSVHWLPLPNDLKTEIDDILSELESSDFAVDSKGFFGIRRIFNIFGSCLFYKGYLLANHLPKDDLLDIYLFLHYNHILQLTHQQPISQIIIWKEVFPSRHQMPAVDPDPEFKENHGRWFMLIVVMQQCILAALLDDGGCALKVDGEVPPEPFYVEEVQNTLFILQDCGISSAAEKLLLFCVLPEVSSNMFYKDNSCHNCRGNLLSPEFGSNFCIHTKMSSDQSTSHSSLLARKESPADGESDSESSGSSESFSNFEKRFRRRSISNGSTAKSHGSNECSQVDKDSESHFFQRNFSSLPNLSGMACTACASDSLCFENSFRMVSGFRSNLFYYLHMDPVEGIFISPVVHDSLTSIQNSILNNFRRCCLSMRTVFERSLRNGEIIKANIKTKYGVKNFLQNAYEQGVQFQSNEAQSPKQKGSSPPVCFWVIGRLFFTPEPREIYVCHLDSTAPDIVEMAFQLGFGLSL